MATLIPRLRDNSSIRDSLAADGFWRYEADVCEWGALPVAFSPDSLGDEPNETFFMLHKWISVYIVSVVCATRTQPRAVFVSYFAAVAESSDSAESSAKYLAEGPEGENEVIRAYAVELRTLLASGILPRVQMDVGDGEKFVDLTMTPLKLHNEQLGFIGSGNGCDGLCESWGALYTPDDE